MFSGAHHQRSSSNTTTGSSVRGNANSPGDDQVASPSHMAAHYEVHPPNVPRNPHVRPSIDTFVLAQHDTSSRPWLGDAPPPGPSAAVKPQFGLQPPVLPPIPRVASIHDPTRDPGVPMKRREMAGETFRRDGESGISPAAQGNSLRQMFSFEDSFDPQPTSLSNFSPRSASQVDAAWDLNTGGQSNGYSPRMQPSFSPRVNLPEPRSSPHSPPIPREFVDSRDRPYAHPPQRPLVQPTLSAPNLLDLHSSARHDIDRPVTSSFEPPRLSRRPSRRSLSQPSISDGLTGTTLRPSTEASLASASSNPPSNLTIGTPYSETSPDYPPPERVATRPKTGRTTATAAGLSVPTHYSTSAKLERPERPEVKTTEPKKKGRLLNPINLLHRRRGGVDGDAVVENRADRAAQAQALARQRDVAAVGVDKLPADFDPRIKGNVVHDFSAPRAKRNTFGEADLPAPNQLPRGGGPVFVSTDPNQRAESSLSDLSRQDRTFPHTPVFTEHLEDFDQSQGRSPLQAETLENKAFLQRASKHSSATSYLQDNSTLPPFARRSQIPEPAQANLSHDDDSRRSSNPLSDKGRDSSRSSNGEVSPVTNRSSSHQGYPKESVSPISPSSPNLASHQLPGAATGKLPAEEIHFRRTSDVSSRHYSSGFSRAAIEPIAESPVHASSEGISPIEQPPSCFRATSFPLGSDPSRRPSATLFADTIIPPQLPTPIALSESPDTNSLLERTANIPTPDRTPEAELVENAVQFKAPQNPPRLVEKRVSVIEPPKRSPPPNGPKHHPSTASRFSFQYAGGENAAEEHALEEKHRKIVRRSARTNSTPPAPSIYDDEDDYFDEDAMDDLDEMEVQAQQQEVMSDVLPSQIPWSIQQARQMLQTQDSDEESDSDERIATNNSIAGYTTQSTPRDHPAAFRSTSHSTASRFMTRDSGFQDAGASAAASSSPTSPQRSRFNNGSALTINTNVGSSVPVADAIVNHGPSERTAPAASTNAPSKKPNEYRTSLDHNSAPTDARTQAHDTRSTSYPGLDQTRENALLHRDSETRKRNRGSSGSKLGSPYARPPSARSSTRSGSGEFERKWSISHASPDTDPALVANSASPGRKSGDLERRSAVRWSRTIRNDEPGLEKISDTPLQDARYEPPPTGPTVVNKNGFGTNESRDISGVGSQADFSGFNFALDGNTDFNRLPLSGTQMSNMSPSIGSAAVQSPGSHQPPTGHEVYSSYDRSAYQQSSVITHVPPQFDPSHPARVNGEIYNEDIYFDDGNFDRDIRSAPDQTIDESRFDDDSFLDDTNGMADPHNLSAEADKTLCSDGPYPSFALPHAMKAHQRNSRMALQDLPLHEPSNSKLIPQRALSEDATRGVMNYRAAQLPVAITSQDAPANGSANLQSYHAALAEAANQAAAAGRFARAPSISTVGSLSSLQSVGDDEKNHNLRNIAGGYSSERNFQRISGWTAAAQKADRINAPDSGVARQVQQSAYSPIKMGFDFGFGQPLEDAIVDSFGGDDDLVAAANAEVLASDDEGFYGQEFQFYGRPRSNSGEVAPVNGGYFGDDGDDGLVRNKSLKEPNLTPITERSEFSTRNSFVGLGIGGSHGPAGIFHSQSPALSQMPVSPWMENDITSFDQLRKLRANAFGGSNGSLNSSNRSSSHSMQATHSLGGNPRPGVLGTPGGVPMTYGSSNDSSGSSNPPSAQPSAPGYGGAAQESPHSVGSGSHMPFAMDPDATPKRHATTSALAEPTTARKVGPSAWQEPSHSRRGSGADSVTYVREPDPGGSGKSHWVLERRRTSEQGQIELVRELVQGGWI